MRHLAENGGIVDELDLEACAQEQQMVFEVLDDGACGIRYLGECGAGEREAVAEDAARQTEAVASERPQEIHAEEGESHQAGA